MSLRNALFNKLKVQKTKAATSSLLTTMWSNLTATEQNKLVIMLLENPCEAGKAIQAKLETELESQINTELNTTLATTNTTIDITYLENLFK